MAKENRFLTQLFLTLATRSHLNPNPTHGARKWHTIKLVHMLTFSRIFGICLDGFDDMNTHPVEIDIEDLQEHWRQLHSLAEDDWIEAVSIHEMPPWRDICEKLDWRTHRLSRGYFKASTHGKCGVYRLIALQENGDLSKPATIARICGEDRTGTLYIGEAGDLSLRLNQMRRSACEHRSEGSHSAITMLRRIRRLNYPAQRLAVALMFTRRFTRAIERDLLHTYINSFGEMPPLNYRL